VALIARQSESELNWAISGRAAWCRPGWAAYAQRFCLSQMFYPRLQKIMEGKRGPHAALLGTRFDRAPDVDISDKQVRELLEDQRCLSTVYLTWLREIHFGNEGSGFQARLANAAAIADPESRREVFPKTTSEHHAGWGRPSITANHIWRCHDATGRSGHCGRRWTCLFQRKLFLKFASEDTVHEAQLPKTEVGGGFKIGSFTQSGWSLRETSELRNLAESWISASRVRPGS